MALKTFNLDEAVYKEFSKHCKKEGISMSKKIENFLKGEVGKLQLQGKKQTKPAPNNNLKLVHHSFSKYC